MSHSQITFLENLAIIKAILPKKATDELKAILKSDYGQDISTEQAERLGTSLLRLTKVSLGVLVRQYDKEKKEKTN